MCKKNICTTSQILGACKVALSQGRYTYRHDGVLKTLVSEFIKFVKQGTISKKSKKVSFGILHQASDWVLLDDLDNLVIPSFIAVSSLRPDILLFSMSTKKVVIL